MYRHPSEHQEAIDETMSEVLYQFQKFYSWIGEVIKREEESQLKFNLKAADVTKDKFERQQAHNDFIVTTGRLGGYKTAKEVFMLYASNLGLEFKGE